MYITTVDLPVCGLLFDVYIYICICMWCVYLFVFFSTMLLVNKGVQKVLT